MNIKEYSKLLGVKITESELVRSHINLKEELKEYKDKTKQMWDTEREKVHKYCEEHNSKYISIEKLKNMTIKELCNTYHMEGA